MIKYSSIFSEHYLPEKLIVIDYVQSIIKVEVRLQNAREELGCVVHSRNKRSNDLVPVINTYVDKSMNKYTFRTSGSTKSALLHAIFR